MITADSMRKSLEKAEVAYHEFVLHTRLNIDGLFCFFEGERGTDNHYYVPRIKKFTDSYYPITCCGREKVLAVQQMISQHREYDKYRKAFFIDRDFNQPQDQDNILVFETPCYSIENFYVSVDVFKEILRNVLQVSEVNEIYNLCVDLYSRLQEEFHDAVTLFNAWYSCLIEYRNINKIETGVQLDSKFPKGFIEISLERVSKNYNFNKIKETFPKAVEVPEEKLNEKVKEFLTSERHKVFRGKYEMQFLLKVIELMIADSSTTNKYFKKAIKHNFGGINNDQAINIFSAYAETPESLNLYLMRVTGERN